MSTQPATDASAQFHERLFQKGMSPLWEVLSALVPSQPSGQARPAFWRYEDIRPLILEATQIISAEKAERRVLVLENPAFRGESRATGTLYAGVQSILPGEIAPAHRHTQSALRFIMEGEGAYTAVEGEKAVMHPGDLVLTPAWTWHDHGNQGKETVMWLDCLDIPLVAQFGATFAEKASKKSQSGLRPTGDSQARYGANMLPLDHPGGNLSSPLFTYPYASCRGVLERLKEAGECDPCHGIKMKYINPVTGGYALATIACFLQLLPKEFETAPYRSTDATIFVAVEGHGTTTVDGHTFDWRPRDIFVVPSWSAVQHAAAEESVLFSCSDRGVQEKLGFWREQRGNG